MAMFSFHEDTCVDISSPGVALGHVEKRNDLADGLAV
jgi:hypothetical protein